jgi:hypothetical protein
MQNAKDTFYITLRSRLATTNPARTMTLRAVTRPGILVSEAEAPTLQPLLDAFALSWTAMQADLQLPAINAGLDRGRALEEMDYEVLKLLYPYSAQKMNYTQNLAAAMETVVFWSEPEFGPVVTLRDRLSRTVKVTVFAFQEQGEQ